jgi:zinc protease
MKMRCFVLLIAGLLLTAGCETKSMASLPDSGGDLVAEFRKGVRTRKLDNGLVLIVKENHTAQVVSVYAVVRAGGILEEEYLGAGISHLTEHLVAGGSTANRTERQIADTLDEIGGVSNAYTSTDRTAYFINAMPEHVGTAIDLVADYMQNALIKPDEFEREFGVVQREILDGAGKARRQAAYLLTEALFPHMPQGLRVIGYYKNIQKLTRDDVVAYHKRMYTPSNTVVCVAGDIDGAAVMKQLEAAYGTWQGPHVRPAVLPDPVPPVTDIVAVKEMDTRLAQVHVAYHSCRLSHPDLYPLDVLAGVLGNGDSSRLAIDLKTRRNLVYNVSCWNYTPAWPGGEFAVSFVCAPDKVDEVRVAVAAHLARVCQEPPTAEEIEKVKRLAVVRQLLGNRTAAAQARSLATDQLSLGDPYFSARYAENLQRVTREDVLRVAQKYLRGTRSVTAIVRPKGTGADATSSADAAAKPSTTRTVFPESGLTLLVHRTPGQPAVGMVAAMKAGQSVETTASAGISAMTARYLERGTTHRSETEIAEFLDARGGSISAGSGWNSIYVEAVVMKQDLASALDVFADVVLNPAFKPDLMASMRDRQLAALKATQGSPRGEGALYFAEKFFPGSPYRFPGMGTPESINAATVDGLRAFYDRVRVGRNMVITIAGDVDPAEVEGQVRILIAAHLTVGRAATMPKGITPRQVASKEIHVLPVQKPGAMVIVGYPGTDLFDTDDRVAMDVFDTVCSGYYMPGGWLHETLRGQSLVYGVHFVGRAGLLPGFYRSQALCQPDKVTRVARLMMDLIESGRDAEFTDDDLRRAKATILSSRRMNRQTPEQVAMNITFDELYGLGYQYEADYSKRIQAVTATDVQRVVRRFIGNPVVCITTPKPGLIDMTELKRPYDAAKLKVMRAETPTQVHRSRSHTAPQ